MTRLALASLRSRSSSSFAYFLSVFLGSTVIGAFATLLETANSIPVGDDRDTLTTIAAVVGGWGLVIVFFSVAATIGLTVRQRSGETSLLRSIGATPGQIRRMILAESTVVTLVAALLAAGPAWLVGRAVLKLLQHADLVADSISAGDGVLAIVSSWLAITLVSVIAVVVATHRAAKVSVRVAQVESSTGPTRMSRWRIAAGILFLIGGVNDSLLTVTVMAHSKDPYAPMSTAGPACVFAGIGLATLAPALVRMAAALGGRLLPMFGTAGHLAGHDIRTRYHLLSGILAPVIVFVGIGVGTIYLVAIENLASGASTSPDGQSIELLNYVVVGMISVFAAIMIINTLAAVISARRQEFGQQRLAGATPGQVRTAMLLEGGFLAVTGIVAGTVAAAATVLPYSWVKLDRLLPDVGFGYFIAVASLALLLTLGAGYLLTGRALRQPAVEAVALATT
jgi:cell division protein FtsX